MIALSGVRSSWLAVARKLLFIALADFGVRTGELKLLVALAAGGDVPEDADDLRNSSRLGEVLRPQLEPVRLRRFGMSVAAADADCRNGEAPLDCGVGDGLEESRPVGDVDAVEQAAAKQSTGMHAEQGGRRIAGKQHLSLRIVPGHEIPETLCDQAVLISDLQVLAMAQVEFAQCKEAEPPSRRQQAEMLCQPIAGGCTGNPAEPEKDCRGDAAGNRQRQSPAYIGRLDDENGKDGKDRRGERSLRRGHPAGGGQEAGDREDDRGGEPPGAGRDEAGDRLRRATEDGDAGDKAEASGEGQHDRNRGEPQRTHSEPGCNEPLVPGVELRVGRRQRMNECTKVPRYRCPGLFAAHVIHPARAIAHP